ncbi:MAG: polysaccharide deacetylase family protein [Acidobacteria bacterium]|nr:polysaccharide deacetylase family protein [Acidobacteriota bacterium]
MTLHLLVGIDTEGDNQWSVQSRESPTYENIYALARLHERLQRYRVRPTYFVTYPVARDPRSADVLRSLAASGECEIGAHHHAWETPPCAADDRRRHPYALALPQAQFDAQLHNLTSAIAEAIGCAPVSYRSGRFGFCAAHVSALERRGYVIESSVAPLFYEAHKAGPDFVGAPLTPYFLAYDDAREPGTSNVLEVPVSAALNRRIPAALACLYARAPRPYTTKRLLRAVGIARMQWLRPSYSPVEDMIALARRLARGGEPVLNVLFHSSEAIVGGSPYNRTEEDLERFLARLDRFLTFATAELGAVPVTFREFRTRFCAPLSKA